MQLRPHAVTTSLPGESRGAFIPSVSDAKWREVGYAVLYPNLLVSPHPD
jgi:hypothetical protein